MMPPVSSGPQPLSSSGGARTAIADCPILIVDDTDFNRTLIGAFLADAGFRNLSFASSGPQALELIATKPFDLVILDILMPGMDGFEVCRRVRSDPFSTDLPILVQSALSSTDDRNRSFAAGAVDLITKPIDRTELLARVRIQLESRVLIRDLSLYRDRVEGELAIARSMFDHMLPSETMRDALRDETGIALLAHSVVSSDLGGDFWGMFRLAGPRVGVFLINISGQGVSAAMNAFRLHTVIQEFGQTLGDDPEAFLTVLNDCACEFFEPGQQATVLYGVVDANDGYFRYVAAGAANPLVITPDGRSEMGYAGGVPLGVSAKARYESSQMRLPPGSVLALYSVAVLSALDSGGTGIGLGMMFSRAVAEGGGKEGFARVAEALSLALGDKPGDDRTLLWIERRRQA